MGPNIQLIGRYCLKPDIQKKWVNYQSMFSYYSYNNRDTSILIIDMKGDYSEEQWRYMDEMCILVDSQDQQIGNDTKKNCLFYNLDLSL